MFRHIVLILVGMLACSAQAGMYRWVDPQGGVHFGDTPPAEGAEPIQLQGIRPPDKSKTAVDSPASAEADTPPAGDGNTQLTVVQPTQAATVLSAGGEVVLQVMLEPKLQAGHYLEVTLDGVAVGGKQSTNVMVLQSVARGRHVLQVSMFDADGKL